MHLQEKNRLKTKGIFKRFSVNCYGEERTIEKIRELKSEKFKILKKKKGSKEYQKYFLRYNPLEEIELELRIRIDQLVHLSSLGQPVLVKHILQRN